MSPGFLGFVDLEDTLVGSLLTTTTANTPVDADALPTYRVYGPNGFVEAGSVTLRSSAALTAATNATPIVITSALHGLTTGTYVTVANVGGNTAANGVFLVTRVDANAFSLDGTTGSAPYTTGGDWHITGLYKLSLDVQGVDGYEKSEVYQVAYSYELSSVVTGQLQSFQVS